MELFFFKTAPDLIHNTRFAWLIAAWHLLREYCTSPRYLVVFSAWGGGKYALFEKFDIEFRVQGAFFGPENNPGRYFEMYQLGVGFRKSRRCVRGVT